MFYTGDHELRAIEEENLRWRRRILGGFLSRLGRGITTLLLQPAIAVRRRPAVSLPRGPSLSATGEEP